MYFNVAPISLRLFAIHVTFVGLSLWLLYLSHSSTAMVVILAGIILYLVLYRRLDYLDPLVIFLLPWIVILGFSLVPLSGYAISLRYETYRLIILAMLAALVVSGPRHTAKSGALQWKEPSSGTSRSMLPLYCMDAMFYVLTVLNVVFAGYIPLLRGVLTGDTGYLDFGVHGLYGFYLAFANAWGIFHFVVYLRTGRFRHMVRYCLLIVIFILFVTRQNLMSLMVESVIVYSLVKGKVRAKTMTIILIVAGVVFSVVGSFRSGDIKTLVNVRPDYMWVPAPFIWLYAYSYFNVANVNNMMFFSNAPYYDGSSLAQLIPSFLRPSYEGRSYLEVSTFNVSSYLTPVYEDMGAVGIILLTMVAIGLTQYQRRSLSREASLFKVGTFAMLYFCAGFSFFVNFWFYLPVIFQMAFFAIMSNLAERTVANETVRTVGLLQLPGEQI
jgi:oligosaccharide repeat unit polymerase